MGYGTGAIMAVPRGDQRDFEFATGFGLDIPPSSRRTSGSPPGIEPTLDTAAGRRRSSADAPYVNSANGDLDLNDGTLGRRGHRRDQRLAGGPRASAKATVTYKLRDWLFSRQRYWGEPFPIVYDVDGTRDALPDDMLPLRCRTPTTSPRARSIPTTSTPSRRARSTALTDWVEVDARHRRRRAALPARHQRHAAVGRLVLVRAALLRPDQRERVRRPRGRALLDGPADRRPDHPGGVDLYVGGVEHAVLHLLYARFWHKVLFDLGHVSSPEPYARLFNQGYVLAAAYTDERGIYVEAPRSWPSPTARSPSTASRSSREWGKMGKSLKNAVSPEDIYDEPTGPTRCGCT